MKGKVTVTLMKEAAFSAEKGELLVLFILFGAMSQNVALRTATTMEGRGITVIPRLTSDPANEFFG